MEDENIKLVQTSKENVYTQIVATWMQLIFFHNMAWPRKKVPKINYVNTTTVGSYLYLAMKGTKFILDYVG